MGFCVWFDDLRGAYETVGQQINAWQKELEALQKGMQKVIDLDSFQGTAAASVKAYYAEVQALLLSAVGTVLTDFMTKFFLYEDGYYAIDGDIHTKLDESTLNDAIHEYKSSRGFLSDSQSSLKSALSSVSDIFFAGIPAVGLLEDNHAEVTERIKTVRDKVDPYEDSVLNSALKELETFIDNTRAYIKEYRNGDRNIMVNYTSGDYIYDKSAYNLAVSMNAAANYQKIHEKELQEAIDRQEGVYAQLQAEYEAERERLAKERADQGGAQIIMGVVAAGVGIAAIVCTAGAATPIVVTAAVTGTCTTLYGVSEIAEGSQHVYYGLRGDPYTSAFNPIRDTVFMGNQDAYSLWGNLNMTVAGMCIPVGKATKGLDGVRAVKAGARAAVKEIAVDKTSEFIAQNTSEFIFDKANIKSKTAQTLINLGVESITSGILEKGVDSIDNKIRIKQEIKQIRHDAEATGKGFAGLMNEADAARYEAYFKNLENNTPDIGIEINTNPLPDTAKIEIDIELPTDPGSIKTESDIPKTPEQILAERTEGLDLEEHPSKYKKLSDKKMSELKQKMDDRTMTKKEYKQYRWNQRMDRRRDEGVRRFWDQEKLRIENGEPTTRDWTPEQKEAILNGEKPKYNGETIQGHHSYSVSKYPHLADKGEVIYPATRKEHFEGWHGGDWKNSEPGRPVKDVKEF